MADILKPLLEAELEAQKVVDQAFKERDHMVEQAQEDVRVAEERFTARIPELRESFTSKAQERADQAVAELDRRYQERSEQLQSMAQERWNEATQAALDVILRASRSEG